jgi:hypothetical protein
VLGGIGAVPGSGGRASAATLAVLRSDACLALKYAASGSCSEPASVVAGEFDLGADKREPPK